MVQSFSNYQAIDIKAFAKLAMYYDQLDFYEELYFDIISVSTHFALNSIPTATVTCNVGRNLANGQASILHKLIRSDFPQVTSFMPIIVYARVKPTSATAVADYKWLPPNNKGEAPAFILFMGYVTGIGIDTSTSSHRMVFHCTSFLSDLTFSSAVSRTSVPSNPAHISFNPTHATPVSGATGLPGAMYSEGLPHMAGFNEVEMRENVWGALGKYFDNLCSTDRFGLTPEFAGRSNNPNANINYEALRALRFFEGFPNGVGYKYGVPAKLRIGQSQSAGMEIVINNMIKAFMSTGKPDSIATTTLWDKLIGEYCSMFMLAVVPMIDRCLVVPYLPNYKKHYLEIYAWETMAVSSQTTLIRPLRGVAVVVTGSSVAGTTEPGVGAAPSTEFVGGYYESADFPTGQIMVKRAPPWLENCLQSQPTSFKAAAPKKPKGTSASPKKGESVGETSKRGRATELVRNISDIFAELHYGDIRLKDRQMILTTNFRVDIAPGSVLKVNVAEDPYVLNTIGLPRKVVYGSVNRVSCAFDCDQQSAYTSINLSHVRTDAENDGTELCTDYHPLYENNFYGCPLVSWMSPVPPKPPWV